MPMLIIGRFIGGIAVGMLTSTIPLYASELSMPKWRGALSGLLQWFLSWGFLIAQWLGYGLSFASGEISCKSLNNGQSLKAYPLQGASHLLSNACPHWSCSPESGSSRNRPDGSWRRIDTRKLATSSKS